MMENHGMPNHRKNEQQTSDSFQQIKTMKQSMENDDLCQAVTEAIKGKQVIESHWILLNILEIENNSRGLIISTRCALLDVKI